MIWWWGRKLAKTLTRLIVRDRNLGSQGEIKLGIRAEVSQQPP